MSFENHEVNGYMRDLDLLIIFIALNSISIMQISHLYCVFHILRDSMGVEREKRVFE